MSSPPRGRDHRDRSPRRRRDDSRDRSPRRRDDSRDRSPRRRDDSRSPSPRRRADDRAVARAPPPPQPGTIHAARVARVQPYGAFVELAGIRQQALVHISQLAPRRVETVEEVVREGDMVWVQILPEDKPGRLSASMKVVDQESGEAIEGGGGGGGGGGRARRGGREEEDMSQMNDEEYEKYYELAREDA